MGLVRSIAGLLSQHSRIEHTGLQKVFTRLGMFQAKMYRHDGQEVLALASLDYFELDTPIVCIGTGTHRCDPLDAACGCHYQTDAALGTIGKMGGLFVYVGTDPRDIDGFLDSIRARKLYADNRVDTDANFRSYLKGLRGWLLVLDYLLKDFGCKTVQLITDNPAVMHVVEQASITIVMQKPAIDYAYGDTVPGGGQAIIEAAKALSFNYGGER